MLFFAIAIPLVAPSPGAAELPAFPGAVGQGAAATGGRGGDVYRVTNLDDYDPSKDESKVLGSLRHAIRSADGPRTIVFDVSGALELKTPLSIHKSDLTIAGQTSPGGVTLWGYPVDLSGSNVVVRFLRFRAGDFHARSPRVTDSATEQTRKESRGNQDLDASSANGLAVGRVDRVMIDHVSASWGMDETLSVTIARNVTVQNSIIAESLNDSFHPKGPHGYGSLVRGTVSTEEQEQGIGGYTFFGNLWAHHRARNPSIGGQQRLRLGESEAQRGRADVNLVSNVIYNWGDRPTSRSNLGYVRVNLIGNYYINGPSDSGSYIFYAGDRDPTLVFHQGNFHDADQDSRHNGVRIESAEQIERAFRAFREHDLLIGPESGAPFNFFHTVDGHVLDAEAAYERVVRVAGASLWRDAVDRRVIDSVVHRTGEVIDSQEQFRDAAGDMPGIDDLPVTSRPDGFDSDGDGMPDEFEIAHGLDPHDSTDGNGSELSDDGYTNLEIYLNSLVADLLDD